MIDLNKQTGTFSRLPVHNRTGISTDSQEIIKEVNNLSVSQTFKYLGNEQTNIVKVYWDYERISDIVYKKGFKFNVEIDYGEGFEDLGITTLNSYSLEMDYKKLNNKDLTFRITAFNFFLFSKTITFQLDEDLTESELPEDFNIYVNSGNTNLSWSDNKSDNHSHYQLRYSPLTSGAVYSNSSLVLDKIKSNSVDIPTRLGTYFLKTVNTSGIKSTSSKTVSTTIPEIEGYKLIQTINDSTAFNGIKSQLTIVSNKLVSTSTSGQYEFEALLDLGGIYTIRVDNELTGDSDLTKFNTEIQYADTITSMADWLDLSTITDISDSSSEFNEFKKFTAVEVTGRLFKFRYTYSEAESFLTLDNYDVNIYIPKRTEQNNSISSGVLGYNVNYGNEFYLLPTISITSDNMQTGDYFTITSSTVSGFTITFYDSTNTAVDRIFGYNATGYGRKNTEIL